MTTTTYKELDPATAHRICAQLVDHYELAYFGEHKTGKAKEIEHARLDGMCEMAALAFHAGTGFAVLSPMISTVMEIGPPPTYEPSTNAAHKEWRLEMARRLRLALHIEVEVCKLCGVPTHGLMRVHHHTEPSSGCEPLDEPMTVGDFVSGLYEGGREKGRGTSMGQPE